MAATPKHPIRETSVSINTLARIHDDSGNVLMLRNRSAFERTGQVRYSAIGGAVVAPVVLLERHEPFKEFDAFFERESEGGEVDLRFRFGRAAETDEEKVAVRDGIANLIDLLPGGFMLPKREIFEELALEEEIVPPDLLLPHLIECTFVGTSTMTERNRQNRALGHRVYSFTVHDVALQPEAHELLLEAAHDDSDSRVIAVTPQELANNHHARLAYPISKAMLL